MQSTSTSAAPRPESDFAHELSAFLRLLEETLGLASNTLTGSEPLSTLQQWDSLAVVQFLALADERFGLILDYERVRACQTFQDLFALLSR